MDEISKYASRKFIITCIGNICIITKILVFGGGPEWGSVLVALDGIYFGVDYFDKKNQNEKEIVTGDKSD